MTNYLIVFCLCCWSAARAANILAYFPTPSYSHQLVFRTYAELLAERGHTVTVIRPLTRVDFARGAGNLTTIDLDGGGLLLLRKSSTAHRKRGIVADTDTVTADNYEALVRMVDEQIHSTPFQRHLKSYRGAYDLLVVEAFVDYALIASHLFGDVPVVQISSGHATAENFETMGATSRHPRYYPNLWRFNFGPLGVWDGVRELYTEFRLQREFSLLADRQDALLTRRFGSSAPGLRELRSRVRLLFVNVHSVFDNNRPVPPSVQYLGGLHLHDRRAEPLSAAVARFLNESRRGVVYVSFGSGIDTEDMDADLSAALLDAFKMMPYDVLWKHDGRVDGLTIPDNVLVQKWFAQFEVLQHKNVKAFVTQAGVQSTDEAVENLIPLVGVPFMGDQAFNAHRYVELGIGVALDATRLRAIDLARAVEKVTADRAYRTNLERLRRLLRHQCASPTHKAVWYTEHALRRDGAAFKTKAANVDYAEYCMSDLLLPLVSVSLMSHLQSLIRMFVW
ncbi:ecysteroid UDP-glucosyltransferase [Lymantria xylina nucleopolyhedrovirus]|uniref:Ecdysteroid UDP-glucosyltransferase n=1 Tax=Lymantria xylina multiple nucleopolyhedrovirus TaxID=2847840 RepID=D4N2G9_9ABAC|nr:ecysteroid UDP-glucosyltransferase [Lymantria xylina nucleopolyhedrovirus]ADD73841.1 ecysteroid UDP-glucosyltransferase [Lymantria xylina nucleopolyhedrovirus]